jgi:hypothetical protein
MNDTKNNTIYSLSEVRDRYKNRQVYSVIVYITKVELNEENSISENELLWKIWQENTNLVINTEYEMVIGIYDLAGNVSTRHNLNSGKNIIPLRVKSGIYILSDEKGNRFRFYLGN